MCCVDKLPSKGPQQRLRDSEKGRWKVLEGMWSVRASPEAVGTMLGLGPGHLPASLPGPSPRTSPRLRLVTRLALSQGLGGPGAPFLEAHLQAACWEGPLSAPRPRRFLETVTEGVLFLVSTVLHEADAALQLRTPGRT